MRGLPPPGRAVVGCLYISQRDARLSKLEKALVCIIHQQSSFIIVVVLIYPLLLVL